MVWRVSNYEAQGRSHKKHDLPCQDKTWSQTNGTVFAAALADGAGSAPYSHFGAECVTRCICAYLIDNYDSIYDNPDGVAVKKEILAALRYGLGMLADELGCSSRDLASTLLAVAIKDNTYLIVHLGDGIIGYLEDEKVNVASHPKNGEFMNETSFVTSAEAPMVMKIFKGKLEDIEGFILMSDGTAEALYDRRAGVLAPSVKSLFDWTSNFTLETTRKNLRSSFKTIQQRTADDCSVLIMTKSSTLKPSGNLPRPHLALGENHRE